MNEDTTYTVAADELKQFIEQYEQLQAEKDDIAEAQKDVITVLKSRGYDATAFKTIIRRRKLKPDDIAEQEAIVELYLTALESR